jgi:hypothetical protein
VVTNSWIKNARKLATERPWLLVDEFSHETYEEAAIRLTNLLGDRATTRLTARNLATREFALETAIDRYHLLYLRILEK